MRDHVIAVDVGTASVRAGVFDKTGIMLARTVEPLRLRRPGARRGRVWGRAGSGGLGPKFRGFGVKFGGFGSDLGYIWGKITKHKQHKEAPQRKGG